MDIEIISKIFFCISEKLLSKSIVSWIIVILFILIGNEMYIFLMLKELKVLIDPKEKEKQLEKFYWYI